MRTAAVDCHPTAVVHHGARIGDGARIGPYCIIGGHVEIGRDTVVEASAVIGDYTTIGERCRIFPFASIGLEPQDLKFKGEVSSLTIGDDNIFREFVTIHRGTALGGGRTRIGNRNLFMAYTHVAHDCLVGSSTIFGNAATLGGHVRVEDHATVSAYSGVHQFCRVGTYAFVGGYTVVTKDVLPFSKTVGNRARLYGANTIGLERRGFPRERIEQIRAAFRVLQQSCLNVSQAVERLADNASDDVRTIVEFVRSSDRGVIVKRGREDAE
ncbi:MAG TPA: acyl-ACP--UDP-N-acetylglucosamine O-acyltransferase [Vicinamibacteria bacterium]|nr:acyl-ACP--UDP-N-acetylglucosamine O-acyltransferase [Vicinamibacteria bacterium]